VCSIRTSRCAKRESGDAQPHISGRESVPVIEDIEGVDQVQLVAMHG